MLCVQVAAAAGELHHVPGHQGGREDRVHRVQAQESVWQGQMRGQIEVRWKVRWEVRWEVTLGSDGGSHGRSHEWSHESAWNSSIRCTQQVLDHDFKYKVIHEDTHLDKYQLPRIV